MELKDHLTQKVSRLRGFLREASSGEAATSTAVLERDADRYRKLRHIACERGDLEATIALGQFDFLCDNDKFDAAVDAL